MFLKNNKNELNYVLDNSKDIFDKIIKKNYFMEEVKKFPMSEIIKKFRSKTDRINFCRENSKYLY